MKMDCSLILAAAMTLAVSAPAAASESADATRGTFLQYAQCTLDVRGERVAQAVSYFPDSREEMRALQALPANECVKYASSTFSTRLFRGALYTAMYQARFASGAPALVAVKPDFAEGSGPRITSEQQAMVQLRDFADCVVRRDSANAHAAVMGPVGSDAEREAFAALQPTMGACMVRGQNVAFSKPVIVGLLAEVMYREAQP